MIEDRDDVRKGEGGGQEGLEPDQGDSRSPAPWLPMNPDALELGQSTLLSPASPPP